jgi:hypothetical protein
MIDLVRPRDVPQVETHIPSSQERSHNLHFLRQDDVGVDLDLSGRHTDENNGSTTANKLRSQLKGAVGVGNNDHTLESFAARGRRHHFLDGLVALGPRVHDDVRSERFGSRQLLVVDVNNEYFEPLALCNLDRELSESSRANDANRLSGQDTRLLDTVEDGDAGTSNRPGVFEFDVVGDPDDVVGVDGRIFGTGRPET